MAELEGEIVRGDCVGQVSLGMNRSAVVELLGTPARTARYDDTTFLAWTSLGLTGSFNGRHEATHLFCFYTLDELRLDLEAMRELDSSALGTSKLACCGLSTARGISGRSREADVREAYGKPTKAFGGEAEGWSRLEYPGIDFRFVDEKLARISLRRMPRKKKR